jgi:YD repeat-containing protein
MAAGSRLARLGYTSHGAVVSRADATDHREHFPE